MCINCLKVSGRQAEMEMSICPLHEEEERTIMLLYWTKYSYLSFLHILQFCFLYMSFHLIRLFKSFVFSFPFFIYTTGNGRCSLIAFLKVERWNMTMNQICKSRKRMTRLRYLRQIYIWTLIDGAAPAPPLRAGSFGKLVIYCIFIVQY